MKKILIALLITSVLFMFSACGGGEDEPVYQASGSSAAVSANDVWVFPGGSSYGDKDISGLSTAVAEKVAESYIYDRFADITVQVFVEDSVFEITESCIEISESNIASSFDEAMRSNSAVNITPEYEMALTSGAQQSLQNLLWSYEVETKNATVTGYDFDVNSFIYEEGVQGKSFDFDKTVELINTQINEGVSANISVEPIYEDPQINADDIRGKFGLLSSFTTYSSNTDAGNHNMSLAMSKINGTVLNPGEQFSFEDTVGNSSVPEGGWQPASGIVNGVLTPVYGGGICQASTTLYVAVLKAGLQIDNRECHSMPSSYVEMGLDATVSYEEFDFLFSNNLDYPIYIEGYMEGLELCCNIYGVQPDWWDEIEISTWTTEEIEPKPGNRYIVDYNLEKDEVVFKQGAQTGYKIDAKRTYYKNGSVVQEEALDSSYYAELQPTYAVGSGVDISALEAEDDQGFNSYY
ncbi:MAG: VanW family protein [Clostridia bacterium]|nr:VanW family protein [Clostridia bacterium]